MSTRTIAVRTPEEVAACLGGITTETLVKILKAKGYAYTELQPGSKPWGRGRQRWGMTDDQIEALIAGQARRMPTPKSEGEESSQAVKPVKGLPGHDGKSRLRRKGIARS